MLLSNIQTSEHQSFIEDVFICVLENAGPSMQIVFNTEGFTDCVLDKQLDVQWGLAEGLIEVLPPDDCVDGDPEHIDSEDAFIDDFKHGTVICMQVGTTRFQ